MEARQESEWQLVIFTILTQMSVGAFVFWGLCVILNVMPNLPPGSLYSLSLPWVSLGLLVTGMVFAGMHLGDPLHSVFSITNLRKSWLSRETAMGSGFGIIHLMILFYYIAAEPDKVIETALIVTGMISGLSLVYTISKLYMLRTVPAWNNIATPIAFSLTTLLTGTVAVVLLYATVGFFNGDQRAIAQMTLLLPVISRLLLLFSLLQIGVFVFLVLYLNSKGGVAAKSCRLLWTDFRRTTLARFLLLFLGILLLGGFGSTVLTFIGAAILLLVSEILGRILFYGFYRREGY